LDIAKKRGAKRAILLPVSAPFHCSLMAPAATVMAEALDKVDVSAPVVPVVANVVAHAVTDPAQIRALLIDQITGSVRWRESVGYMAAEGVTDVFEIGAGKALSGMVKRIDRALTATAVSGPEDVRAVAAIMNN
jgi:[acyl-carrier-protein] S-malonyltransferase